MKISVFSCLVLVLVSGAVSAPIQAAPGETHELLDRFSFTLGGFFTSVNTELRVDSTDGRLGDLLDFENELNLDASETLFRFSAEFLIKRRHQVKLGYYRLSRTSRPTTLTREIQFGDRTFPISVEVNAFFETEVIELSYTYWLVLKDKVAFGISAGGLNFFTFDAGLQAEDANVGIIEGNAGVDIPLPLFGVEVRYAIVPKLMLRGGIRFIAVSDIDGYSGDSVDLSVALEHRTFQHFGFGIGFSSVSLNVDTEKRRFVGDLKYGISGVHVFARISY